MTKKLEALTLQAQKLAPDEQVALVERILDGLEPVDAQVELAWAEEAQRRLERVRSGESETFDADEVIEEVRQRLHDNRKRRQTK